MKSWYDLNKQENCLTVTIIEESNANLNKCLSKIVLWPFNSEISFGGEQRLLETTSYWSRVVLQGLVSCILDCFNVIVGYPAILYMKRRTSADVYFYSSTK